MIVRVIGHHFHYEMENLCRVFYPLEQIKIVYDKTVYEDWEVVTERKPQQPGFVFVSLPIAGEMREFQAKVRFLEGEEQSENDSAAYERNMAQLLFSALVEKTGYRPDWGILTGVRPSKLMHKLTAQTDEQTAAAYFCDELFVRNEKIRLTQAVTREEQAVLARSRPDSFSLYISIPFCPSRCSYCSFVSHSITGQNAKKLIPDYVENLCRELTLTGQIAKELGLRCESVYIGGGTPTALDAQSLEVLLRTVRAQFDFSFVTEFTVEAGRADTITREKLEALRRFGADRVSVNPQSFDDTVLTRAGRQHSANDAIEAFHLARSCGFDCINMDVIAGLPGDTVQGFAHTMETALQLRPENLTVHTLALKRASRMMTEKEEIRMTQEAASMLQLAQEALTREGFRPYYMYRQSRCVGNLENVGWCTGENVCAYNIFMMEECHSVLAAGAGAVTKLKAPRGDHIERLFNFKFPYEYNRRFEEMLTRKAQIKQFYEKYR